MISKRNMLVIVCLALLVFGLYTKNGGVVGFTVVSLGLLTFLYERVAIGHGFTKNILSSVTLSGFEIDGKKHILNLNGFDAEKVVFSLGKTMLVPALICAVLIIFNDYLMNIHSLVNIVIGVIFPLILYLGYLMLIAENIRAMEIGTTTIKIIP